MKQFIRIEPRKSYDKAIVRKLKSGKLVYSYYKLIEITMKNYSLSEDDAEQWVDFNIIGGLNDCANSYLKICYK
jgi:hypothetical protein